MSLSTHEGSSLISERVRILNERLCKINEMVCMLQAKLFLPKAQALEKPNSGDDHTLEGIINECHSIVSGIESLLSEIVGKI